MVENGGKWSKIEKNEILLKISEYKLYSKPVPQSKNKTNFFAPLGDFPEGF